MAYSAPTLLHIQARSLDHTCVSKEDQASILLIFLAPLKNLTVQMEVSAATGEELMGV